MARKPLRPLIRSGGFYPSKKWTPLVYAGGYTTANGGGEPEPSPIEKTVIGNPIHITDALAKPVQALSIALEPIQDLHGYDNPWPGGGGKNKFDVGKMVNTAGITINNGVISVTGNSINSTKKLSELADLTVGETYILTANTTGTDNLIYLYGTGANVSWGFGTSKTMTQEMLDALVFFYGGNNTTSQISNFMIRLASVSDATFAPYSNICPISGWTQENVLVFSKGDVWHRLKAAVDTGKASSFYKVGDQITDTWYKNSGTSFDAPWDVVHIDSNGEVELKWHYSTPDGIPFDEPEAIYFAPDGGLAAGTYHIPIGQNWSTGWANTKSIQFTLTDDMAAGDQLVIDCGTNNANDPTDGRTWKTYAKGSTTVKQTGTTSNGTGGTSLGTIGATNLHKPEGNLNAISRVVYGYGRWSQSAMRQWLNSQAAAGAWWTPQNDWDRPPSVASTLRGFMAGISHEMYAVMQKTQVVTALNTQEGFATDTETTEDYFFLPSLEQMYINPQLAGVEGDSWDYFKDLAEEAGLTGMFQQYGTYPILITYNCSNTISPVYVWLRSCLRGYAYYEWLVSRSGTVGTGTAHGASRGCPACKIKKSSQTDSRAYTVDLNGTVYGGTLDVLTGVLTVTMAIVDLGSNPSWNYYSYGGNGGGYNNSVIASMSKRYTADVGPNAVCSALVVKSDNGFNLSNTGHDLTINVNASVKVTIPEATDTETLKAALNGVQLCYELATPQTIQLTPTQVELLLGENNLFSDGEMTLVYLADGNASDVEALNILLGGRYVNNHGEDELSDREALDILLSR